MDFPLGTLNTTLNRKVTAGPTYFPKYNVPLQFYRFFDSNCHDLTIEAIHNVKRYESHVVMFEWLIQPKSVSNSCKQTYKYIIHNPMRFGGRHATAAPGPTRARSGGPSLPRPSVPCPSPARASRAQRRARPREI